ncbi:cupin domain-containing protein [Amphibacillus sp. MSJ-3]|uniref:cupin domain-containing protein n=1 Tax=Amphibacillus sp. MSJ-3 TaxID=2841505 RepID=UPI0020A01D95|nr:cupin domain-containing protein [Amphibacillus sp. MSJ-3]
MGDLPIKTVFGLEELAIILPDQIVSTAIAEAGAFDITTFGLDEKESISTEIVGQAKLIYCLEGRLEITANDVIRELEAGFMILLGCGTRHSIKAKTKASFQQVHIYQTEENEFMINKIPHNETIRLAEQIEIVPNRKTSKSLVQHKTLTLTLFALDAGQQIARHTATGDALVQILEGEALITIDQTDYTVKAGESIVMPAEIPHALEAVEAFKMLLTVVKPGE